MQKDSRDQSGEKDEEIERDAEALIAKERYANCADQKRRGRSARKGDHTLRLALGEFAVSVGTYCATDPDRKAAKYSEQQCAESAFPKTEQATER